MFKKIFLSIVFKVASALIMLLSVPLLLKNLGVHDYGVWASLTSLLVWITLFDFGVGHALKNTVSKGVAKKNFTLAKLETIQNLKLMLGFCILLSILLIVAINNIELLRENFYVTLVLFIPSIIFFPLTMGGMILQGARNVALQSGLILIGPGLFLFYLLIGFLCSFNYNLLQLALIYVSSISFSLILIWIVSTKKIGLKTGDYKKILSTVMNYKRLRLGLKFFGLQVSSIVLYGMGPFLIIIFLSAEDVTYFDILNKMYVFGISFFSIGIAVYWPELSYYREKKDYDKVYKIYYIMIFLSFLFAIGAISFAFLAPYLIKIWVGNSIQVTWNEAIYFSLLVSVQAIAYSGAVMLNVFEKINIQLALAICSTLLMLPLTVFFIDNGYGIISIPLSASLLTLIPAIYCNYHALIILKNEKSIYVKENF